MGVSNPTYARVPLSAKGYASFEGFYPFYLGEHRDTTCRRLHLAGTSCVVALTAAAAWTAQVKLLLAVPLVGYGMAWVGHFFFEHNKPATFKHPLYSLMGDFKM
ncbi:hypothetical protein N2152v2_002002 [Parachlorella kessleri]